MSFHLIHSVRLSQVSQLADQSSPHLKYAITAVSNLKADITPEHNIQVMASYRSNSGRVQTKRVDCWHCSGKEGHKRKQTTYECVICGVGVCFNCRDIHLKLSDSVLRPVEKNALETFFSTVWFLWLFYIIKPSPTWIELLHFFLLQIWLPSMVFRLITRIQKI